MTCPRLHLPTHRIAAALLFALSTGCTGLEAGDFSQILGTSNPFGQSQSTIAAGLQQALEIGAQNAANLASAKGGFLDNARIHIPLPGKLDQLASTMRTFGLAKEVDALEVAMNRAAEEASGQAFDVFKRSLTQMTFQDAQAILAGSDTAATDYFRRTSSDALRARFEPIIDQKIHEVGLAQLYGDVMSRLRMLPVPMPSTPKLETYVTDQALAGLFTLMGDEEKKIRQDPAARTTELLREVFGNP